MKLSKGKLLLTFTMALITVGVVYFIQMNNPTIVSSDYEAYENERNIVKASDIIVAGDVLDVKAKDVKVYFTEGRVYKNNEDKRPYTVSAFRVSKVLKGNVKVGDVIEVKQSGDGKKIIEQSVVDNGGYFVKNTKKVLFLKSFANYNVPYSVLNPIQGQYSLENGVVKATSKFNKLFSKDSAAFSNIENNESNYTLEEFADKVKNLNN